MKNLAQPIIKVQHYSHFHVRIPAGSEEKFLWVRVFLNKLRNEVKDHHGKTKKAIGICYKHFLADCPKKNKRDDILVPTVQPSPFGKTNDSLFFKNEQSGKQIGSY